MYHEPVYMLNLPHMHIVSVHVVMGVDRWGQGGHVPPLFNLGDDSIGNVPSPFQLKKKSNLRAYSETDSSPF